MIAIVPYKHSWHTDFKTMEAIKSVLEDLALAIHHIGSNSVLGLSSKDVIDIQLTVEGLDQAIAAQLLKIGFTRVTGEVLDYCFRVTNH